MKENLSPPQNILRIGKSRVPLKRRERLLLEMLNADNTDTPDFTSVQDIFSYLYDRNNNPTADQLSTTVNRINRRVKKALDTDGDLIQRKKERKAGHLRTVGYKINSDQKIEIL